MKIRILLMLLVLISTKSIAQDINKISVGDSLIDFSWRDSNDQVVQLSDFKGKLIILNFSATYCGPCWNTYEPLNNLLTKYKDELVVISFHLDDKKELWHSIAEKRKITFDCISVWNNENKKQVIDQYGVNGYPYFVLINKEGIVFKKWFGDRENKLNNLIGRRLN